MPIALLLVVAAASVVGCGAGDGASGPFGSAGPGSDGTAPASGQLAAIDSVVAAGRSSTTATVPIPTTTIPPTTVAPAPVVTWQPRPVPATIEGMQTYFRTELGCDTFEPVDDVGSGSFECTPAATAAPGDYDLVFGAPNGDEADLAAGRTPDDADGRLGAVSFGFTAAQSFRATETAAGGSGVGRCWLVASAGAWTVSYADFEPRPGDRSPLADLVADLDAVVHKGCGQPGLGPDTATLIDAIGGAPTCGPVEVAVPAGGPAADGVVDWADYDTAFTCTNGYSMVRVPPGTVDSFRAWSAAQVGCRPFVAVGRWVIHQSATTALPADYDQSVLTGIATTYGTTVVNPCS